MLSPFELEIQTSLKHKRLSYFRNFFMLLQFLNNPSTKIECKRPMR